MAVYRSGLAVVLLAGAVMALGQPGWVAGDFHQHSTYTDGSYKISDVHGYNQQYGLDWWANSEHGGGFTRDGRFANPNVYWDSYTPNPIIGKVEMSGGHQKMWRWQSLRDYSFYDAVAARAQYNKPVIQGVEWNPPGHEHCSVGIITGQFGANPNAAAVAEFEYKFDLYDTDDIGGAAQGWVKSALSGHEKAVEAATWMQANHPNTAWMVPAHPERKSQWSVAAFRDLNNAAPTVAFGFESMPGHQKASDRGEYKAGNNTAGTTTYGGCGIYAAQVGGLWDAMLGEGRSWWLFASSDWHSDSGDFRPGEYQKTYTYVADRSDPQAIVNGLRSGNSFVVTGDLINALDFNANQSATMGQTLTVAPGSDVTINIRFKSPALNNNGDVPVVDHIDLIAGEVHDKIAPEDPAYQDPTNPTTTVVEQFFASDWTLDPDGYYSMSITLEDMQKDMYFRLRGTNNTLNQPFETDEFGNPLSDALAANLGLDGVAEAYADLWFYSNPIFVQVPEPAALGLLALGLLLRPRR